MLNSSPSKLSMLTTELNEKILKLIGKEQDYKGLNSESLKEAENIKEYLKSELKADMLIFYSEDLEILEMIVDLIRENPPFKFGAIITYKIIKNIIDLTEIITAIQTIKTLTRDSDLEIDFIANIQKNVQAYQNLYDLYESYQNKALEYHKELLIQNPVEINLSDRHILRLDTKMMDLSTTIEKWYFINQIKETTFVHEKKKQNIPIESLFLDTLTEFKDIIKKNKKEKQELSINEIISLSSFKQLVVKFRNLIPSDSTLSPDFVINDDDITPVLVYIMFKLNFIIEKENSFKDSLTKKKIKNKLSEFIRKHYSINLVHSLRHIIISEKQISENPDKTLSKTLLDYEKKIEQQTLALKISEVDKKKQFEDATTILFDILNRQNDWFLGLRQYLEPYGDIITKPIRVLETIRDELERKHYNFISYIENLIEQNILAGLNDEINVKIDELENFVKKYEEETIEIIEKEIPQSNKIEILLEDFEKDFARVNTEVSKIFTNYKNKGYNIYDSIKKWEEKFSEIKSRVRFVVSTLLSSLFTKFKSVIEKEKGFFLRFMEEAINSESDVMDTFSFDMIMPEKLNEKQLRERIGNINDKIKELESLKESYQKEREKYENFLREYLKDKSELVSQKCIVCHKIIDVVEDHFIKCEFCGRLMHYLCGAWWLEKHNSCPVCNNEFLVPNSGIYEENYYDPEIDGNLEITPEQSFTEVDLEKYPPKYEETNDEINNHQESQNKKKKKTKKKSH